MELYGDEWGRKGATLSDKTARAEFGLTQDEIIAAIRAGKLQYRPAAMHGNPWLRLLRREVEELVSTQHGDRYLRERHSPDPHPGFLTACSPSSAKSADRLSSSAAS